MPISVIPAATIPSIPYHKIGLLATGTNCFAPVYVKGRNRVPLPPDKISAFIIKN